ncbi:MAG: hypothetical protein ABGZ35_15040 [Planctomycetaceae bacterium]|jgi:WD40 repeat protein
MDHQNIARVLDAGITSDGRPYFAMELVKGVPITDMLLAQRYWEDANIAPLRELLDRHRHRNNLKGFEWDYWNRRTHSSLLTLNGHTDRVVSVSFSPDGKQIVSGSADRTAQLWNAETGREQLTLKGHTDTVVSVSFSPDGKRIASGRYDGTVKVWEARPWTAEQRAARQLRRAITPGHVISGKVIFGRTLRGNENIVSNRCAPYRRCKNGSAVLPTPFCYVVLNAGYSTASEYTWHSGNAALSSANPASVTSVPSM